MANCAKVLESGRVAIGIIDSSLWEPTYLNLKVSRRSENRYVEDNPPQMNRDAQLNQDVNQE